MGLLLIAGVVVFLHGLWTVAIEAAVRRRDEAARQANLKKMNADQD